MSSWRRNLEKFKNVALPVAGFALGGPLGAGIGGALAGATGKGRPTLGNVAKGAGTGYLGGQLAGGLGIQGGQGFGAMASSGKSAVMDPRAALGGLFTGGGSGNQNQGQGMGWGDWLKQPQVSAGIAQGLFGAYEGHQDRRDRERSRSQEMGFSSEQAELQRLFAQQQAEADRQFREQQAGMDRALRERELEAMLAREARAAQQEEEERQRRQYIAQMVAPLFQQAAAKKGFDPSAFGM